MADNNSASREMTASSDEETPIDLGTLQSSISRLIPETTDSLSVVNESPGLKDRKDSREQRFV